MSGDASTSARHVRALDGIRGVAIILVAGYHFAKAISDESRIVRPLLGALYNCWVGVDLFFVLSGYLITSGLVAPTARSGGERLKRFYVRRVLRIFPLYYGTLVVASLVCPLIGWRRPSWTFWLYVNNYAQGMDHAIDWLTHFWSLAVEEQFYLAWPLVVVALSPRGAVRVATTVVVIGLALRGLALAFAPFPLASTDYFLHHATPTHADALLLGALLALFQREPESTAARLFIRYRNVGFFVIAFAFLVPSYLSKGDDRAGRVAAAMSYLTLGVLFALFVALALEKKLSGTMTRALESRALVSCGRVSYGMYVFHVPLVLLVDRPLLRMQAGLSGGRALAAAVMILAGGVVLSWAIAVASYRLYERPFLRLKDRFAD
jgi:peptidoglycan/LPS O-acetylase OafA/YrhL